jgi:hypothetical protein
LTINHATSALITGSSVSWSEASPTSSSSSVAGTSLSAAPVPSGSPRVAEASAGALGAGIQHGQARSVTWQLGAPAPGGLYGLICLAPAPTGEHGGKETRLVLGFLLWLCCIQSDLGALQAREPVSWHAVMPEEGRCVQQPRLRNTGQPGECSGKSPLSSRCRHWRCPGQVRRRPCRPFPDQPQPRPVQPCQREMDLRPRFHGKGEARSCPYMGIFGGIPRSDACNPPPAPAGAPRPRE